jgi:alpha-ketoglutarate-dependent taurine dioxygenase
MATDDVEMALPPGLPNGQRLPLVLRPRAGKVSLPAWLDAHRELVDEKLYAHGALLLRGFPVDDPAEFERVARAIAPVLQNQYLGTSPRDALTPYVFSASELPPYYPIPEHCEMSFLPKPPKQLFFWCAIAPSGPGGETPIVDFRSVARDLDPAVKRRFEERGVRNIRNYCGPEGGSRFDLWKLKRWDEMFQTTDRATVEARCREEGLTATWKPEGRLSLTNTQEAFRKHPRTGEQVWFNHSQVLHLSSVPGEFRRIAARRRRLQHGLLTLVAEGLVRAKLRLTPIEDQAMHCVSGDGSPIPRADMDRVRDAIWKNLVALPWQQGDVLAIDNFAVAHGRMPYRGPRKVCVCWA